MEGERRQQQDGKHRQQHQGRSADSPVRIPKKGWKDILRRTKDEMQADNLPMVAGGVAFFFLLGLVPGIAAAISIYGLFANPSDIQQQFSQISGMIPQEVSSLLKDQMTRIASDSKAAGWGAALSILLALWGGSSAMKGLIGALNIVYEEDEGRSFIKLSLVALGLTLAMVVLGLFSIGLIVVIPPLLSYVGMGKVAETIVSLARWPLLFVVALTALAILYRYGPNRDEPQWRWISPGAVLATLLWVIGSILFSVYATNFGNYNKTYGSLGAVVVLMMWLYISSFVVLLGAELNSEAEHQTAKDTTEGEPEPMGRRGAYMADNVAEDSEAEDSKDH